MTDRLVFLAAVASVGVGVGMAVAVGWGVAAAGLIVVADAWMPTPKSPPGRPRDGTS